jgi:hypothetical protein
MRIDCYMSFSCSSEEELRDNISKALTLERKKAKVNFYRITDDEADIKGLKGSPSVLIDGVDIQPADIIGFS